MRFLLISCAAATNVFIWFNLLSFKHLKKFVLPAQRQFFQIHRLNFVSNLRWDQKEIKMIRSYTQSSKIAKYEELFQIGAEKNEHKRMYG